MTIRAEFEERYGDAHERYDEVRAEELAPAWARVICVACRHEADPEDLTEPVCPYCGFDGEV